MLSFLLFSRIYRMEERKIAVLMGIKKRTKTGEMEEEKKSRQTVFTQV